MQKENRTSWLNDTGLWIFATWILSMLLTGLFFYGLWKISPFILAKEEQMGHWQYYKKALEKIAEWDRTRWSPDQEKRKRILSEAIEYLTRAHEARPKSRDYLWVLGVTLYNRALMESPPDPRMLNEATAKIRKAWLLSDRRWLKPGMFLAEFHIDRGEYSEAIDILRRLLPTNRKVPKLYELFLKLEKKKGRPQRIIEVLRLKSEYLRLTPEDRELLVESYLALGRADEAEAELGRMIRSGIRNNRVILLLGISLLESGQIQKGIDQLEDWLKLGPGESSELSSEFFPLSFFPRSFFPVLGYALLESLLEVSTQ